MSAIRKRKLIVIFSCFFLCVYFYSFIAVSEEEKPANKAIRKLAVVKNYPFFNKNGLKYFNDSSCIYYADSEYLVYQSPIRNIVEYVSLDTVITFDTYNYYCVKRGKNMCLLYRRYFSGTPEFVNVDSLIKKGDLMYDFDIYPIYSIGKVFADSVIEPGKRKVRCFLSKEANQDSYDTASFHFDQKLVDVELSFSKNLDSLYQSKLVEINLISNQFFSVQLNMMVPKRVTRIAMNYVEPDKNDSVLYLIAKSREFLK